MHGVGGFERTQQIAAAGIKVEHFIYQVLGRGSDFLIDRRYAPALGRGDFAAAGLRFAQNEAEQGRLANAVQPDQTGLGARRQGQGGAIKKAAAIGIVDQVGNLQHVT